MLIRRPTEADRSAWGQLYAGYADFYGVNQTSEMRDRVWSWIHDPVHLTEALVAEYDERLVGLAHFRPFARPLAASTGCYLDDLFVDPSARGSGVVDALMRALTEEAHRRDWTVIRWITAENNFRARAVYERVAGRTNWVTYDLKPI
jgi:ribosomal protein S18 acetylase RimI-like enzyme